MEKLIALTEKEFEKVLICERIKNKEITQGEAARILKLSERQVGRKCRRYREEGKQGIIHRGKGKPSNHAIKQEIRNKIIEIIKKDYSNLPKPRVGPTFLAEQLEKKHEIKIDHETLRRLMIKEGLWQVERKKERKHTWRERKHHRGEMVQVDGSEHIWFGDGYSVLVAFIDDATSNVPMAKFVSSESVENLACLTKEYVKKYGRPLSLYTDRGGTYKVNNAKDNKQRKTQFERMLNELSIDLIHARSPQAKGRVERFFKTAQDRLAKELKIENITTIDAANEYLQKVYLPEHNKKFAVEPLKNVDFHRSIEHFDLTTIFCRKENRIINNDYTISFKNRWFQLEHSQSVLFRRGDSITVYENFDGTIRLFKNGKPITFHAIAKSTIKNKKLKEKGAGDNQLRGKPYRKPSANHPWRSRLKEDVDVKSNNNRTFL